jgi:CheY-like chemotaxis protein
MTSIEGAATILVVDDAEANRYLVGTWLRRAGHHVVEAATGTQALERIGEPGIELVLLDVNLPDIDGFTVCDRIKSDPSVAGVPVVLVSATSVAVTDRTRGLAGGADAYLAEPIDPDELVAIVAAMLRYSRARQRTERLAGRLAVLAETTLKLNAARTLDELLVAAARGAARIFDSAAVASAVDHDDTGLSVSVAGAGAPLDVHRGDRVLSHEFSSVLDTRVLHRGLTASWLPPGETAEFLVSTARTRLRRLPTVVAVPAPAGGGLPRSDDEDRDLLSQLGQATALAVEAMRSYAEERTIALTLQRSLLPGRLPHVPGVDIAVRYVPAGATTEIGGDFYEVADLDGRLMVAIGDVTGHSLYAATVMAELRHALRAYASEGHPPAEILERLDAMMRRYHPGTLATVVVLLIDPATGEMTGATGGHLPPLLVTADGDAQYLPLTGTLLGVQVSRPAASAFTVPPGGSVVLVTDGLVEKRGECIDEGLERLRQASASIDPKLEDYCDRILAGFSGSNDDDIALLVLRRY